MGEGCGFRDDGGGNRGGVSQNHHKTGDVLKSAGQSSGWSGPDISHKQDFLGTCSHHPAWSIIPPFDDK